MTGEITVRSPFIEGTRIQYAWDSTCLTVAMSCALRYKQKIIEGWVPRNPDAKIALAFGILTHAGIEQYHRERAAGKKYTQAVLAALRHVMQKTEPGHMQPLISFLPVDADIRELRQEEADDDESDGFDLRNSKIRTRYHLFRALVWYFEQYRSDALEVVILQSGAAAVEHSFRVPVGKALSDGTELLIAGHFDKLIRFNGELYVSDVKTTKSITRTWRSTFDLSHQMTGYTVGGKIGLAQPVRGVWIDAIQLQVGGVKFNRFTTHRSPSQLAEYMDLLKYTADLAESWALNNYYPQNTNSCLFCEYKEVCRQPPEFRQAYLKTYFKQEPAWNPLKSR